MGRRNVLGLTMPFRTVWGGNSSPSPSPFDPATLPWQELWTCNGKTDSNTDKNIPNLVNPTNPLILSNFLFAPGSGYDTYYQSMSQLIRPFTAGRYSIVSTALNSIITAIVNLNAGEEVSYCLDNTYLGVQWKVKITSNIDNFRLQLLYFNDKGIVRTILLNSNEIVTIPVINMDNISSKAPTIKILTAMVPGDWFKIEEISSGNIGLRCDGVDDSISTLNEVPAIKDYTVVGELAMAYNMASGIGKSLNWYWYGKNLYINGSAVSIANPVNNVIGFNSEGLIVRANNSIKGMVGDLNPTASRIDFKGVSKPLMVIKSLGIIGGIYNESEIRAIYAYMKTLKANNIG